MKNIFVVAVFGVYMQAIVGIFEEVHKAIEAANETAENQEDSYHDICVTKFPLNHTTPVDLELIFGHGIVDKEDIYCVNKDGIINLNEDE